jgi:hypothetical protein
MKLAFLLITLLLLAATSGMAADLPFLGDYDAELRDGEHVDLELMVERLTELGANTYMWLVWHSANDWDDLHDFLPLAREAGITVWVYLVPHSETTVQNPQWPYSEPFKLDYVKWAEEIARLSLAHENLVGYVIDDFWGNVTPERFSPEYTRQMVEAGRAINPDLKFYPLMYYNQFGLEFVEKLAPIIDGAVAAYPRDRSVIERALTFLNDDYTVPANATIVFPWGRPSQPGQHGFVTQTATVQDAEQASVTFRYHDDFPGATEGYHFMQLRAEDQVVWEQDAAGPDDGEATVDLSETVAGKQQVKLSFGVFEQKGVGQFGLRARFSDLKVGGLALEDASFASPDAWQQEVEGDFTVEVSPGYAGEGKFHLPLIVMTAGSRGEYKHRWNEEATPERIAAKVRMALDLLAEGKIEGMVTYCLNKAERSEDFEAVAAAFEQFRAAHQQP